MWKTTARKMLCTAIACLLAMLVFAPGALVNPPGTGRCDVCNGTGRCDVCDTNALDVARRILEAMPSSGHPLGPQSESDGSPGFITVREPA